MANDLYRKDEYCMNFTNHEIICFLVNRVKEYPNILVKLSSDDGTDMTLNMGKQIKYVCFDGEKEEFYVSFFNHQTSIFIMNQEFMLIDDNAKENYTSSATYGNVVYEGTLRDKTHGEILTLIFDFFKVLLGTMKIVINETKISQDGWQYPKCDYIIKLTNGTNIKKVIRYANIEFVINEE